MSDPALPLVSVALCVYNGERYLREQLDSILAQEGARLEIVAVDDCSTDGSLALLREYAARDPRIRVVANEANLGHVRSFEKAMSLCGGAFIAPSDQDDAWHPAKLRRLLDAIGDADMAYCDSEYMDGESRATGRRVSDDLDCMHAGKDPLRLVFQNSVSGHALLVRREAFEVSRPFPTQLYHDWWMALYAAAHGGLVYVDAPLVRFRRHAAACSPMGKQGDARPRLPKAQRREQSRLRARNRQWLEERLFLMQAVAATDWPCRAQAQEWHGALLAARDGDSAALRTLCWRDRAALPPWSGPGWYRAYRFYQRCRRKLRHARSEPAPGPLFRA